MLKDNKLVLISVDGTTFLNKRAKEGFIQFSLQVVICNLERAIRSGMNTSKANNGNYNQRRRAVVAVSACTHARCM